MSLYGLELIGGYDRSVSTLLALSIDHDLNFCWNINELPPSAPIEQGEIGYRHAVIQRLRSNTGQPARHQTDAGQSLATTHSIPENLNVK
jgi:hypothetical protein